jgi:hypothetical protein
MKYRVPYKLCSHRAKHKARVAYYRLPSDAIATGYDVLPEPESRTVDIEAETDRDAVRCLAATIRPSDPRPVRSAWMIRWFRIGN